MRRKKSVTIPGVRSELPGERDNGKTFVLTEMDAYSGQDWATRALMALARSNVPLPEGGIMAGWEGLSRYAYTAFFYASHAELKPLLDEMLAQAKYQHNPKHPLQDIEQGPNCVVEEISTFLTLHKELFALHVGFSEPASTPNSG